MLNTLILGCPPGDLLKGLIQIYFGFPSLYTQIPCRYLSRKHWNCGTQNT